MCFFVRLFLSLGFPNGSEIAQEYYHRNIELTSFKGKKKLCDFSDTGILLAKLGPMLVKYLQKRLAISFGLEISRESALNMDGKPRFPLFQL